MRLHLVLAFVLFGVFGPKNLFASCETDAAGVLRCNSDIDRERIPAIFQEKSNWCWAAACEVLLRFHGVSTNQRSIVKSAVGSEANLRADGKMISKALGRLQKLSTGKFVSFDVDVYDLQASRKEITNWDLVKELEAGRPYICGSLNHAFVVVGMTASMVPKRLSVSEVRIWDPLPGRGFRTLTYNEMLSENVQYAATLYSAETEGIGVAAPSDDNDHEAEPPHLKGKQTHLEVPGENVEWEYPYWNDDDKSLKPVSGPYLSLAKCNEARQQQTKTWTKNWRIGECRRSDSSPDGWWK